MYSTLKIDMPPQIKIYDSFEFARSCGSNLRGFNNTLVTCKVRDSTLYVYQGFDRGAT